MELDALRWALRGTAAYRHVVEEAPLRRVLALLDKLAAGSQATCRQKPAFKGENCCLSGIQNICEGLWKKGTPAADVARICLDYLCKALEQMTENALAAHPGLPLIYCGGVMSNRLIRQRIQQRFGGQFAEPQFSSDNASGPAILASVKEEMA